MSKKIPPLSTIYDSDYEEDDEIINAFESMAVTASSSSAAGGGSVSFSEEDRSRDVSIVPSGVIPSEEILKKKRKNHDDLTLDPLQASSSTRKIVTVPKIPSQRSKAQKLEGASDEVIHEIPVPAPKAEKRKDPSQDRSFSAESLSAAFPKNSRF